MSEEELKANLDLITNTISVCIETGYSEMSETVSEAARNYYLSIVNNQDMSAAEKRSKIYQDLVVGTKTNLLQLHNNKHINTEKQRQLLNLSYRIGLDSERICQVKAEIICVGQYTENEIPVASQHVSRIHCFIFQIDDKLIVLDGWSKCGTRTINVACNDTLVSVDADGTENDEEHEQKLASYDHEDNALNVIGRVHGAPDLDAKQETSMENVGSNETETDTQDEKKTENKEQSTATETGRVKKKKRQNVHSLPQQRNILQFNAEDTIHLQLGKADWGTHLILNPKLCIVCMENARVWRLQCGHQVLCSQCYQKLTEKVYSAKCPICCRAFNVLEHPTVTHGFPHAHASAGVHTYTTSALSSAQSHD